MALPATAENELPALGRPLHLGMLYDRRSDTLIPGITLWEPEALQKHVRTKPQPKSECHILASDHYDNLASALNLTLPLKASLLGGKMELNGSAKCLKDSRKSQNQVRLVVHYSITTRFEQLSMSHLGPHNIAYPEAFDQGEATHVVTAVLYGAQAFFVFERETASSENKQDTERELRKSVQSLLQEASRGGGATNVPRKKKLSTEKFRFTFYGDVILKNNPITDPDAMRIYSDLPKLLGENGEKAVPVKVWLYPLAKLEQRAAKLVREVSTDLITRAQAIIEHLSDCQLQCQDLAVNVRESGFPAMCEGIGRFQGLCKRYKELFQERLAGMLPFIRGGEQEEDVLRNLLTRTEQSPFSPKWLAQFLKKKREEADYVRMCCLQLKDAELLPSETELRKMLSDPQHQFLVSFTFTSLQKEEPYLLDLEGWIQEISASAPTGAAYEGPPAKPWFEEEVVIRKVRERIKAFSIAGLHKARGSSPGKVRFVVASVPDQENAGVSIYLYEGGKLVSRDFWPSLQTLLPMTLLTFDFGRVGHDSVELIFSPAPDGSRLAAASGVEFSILGQEQWVALEAEQSQAGENSLLVRPLIPNTLYQFRFAALSSLSLGEIRAVKTRPSGPPGKPQEAEVLSTAVSVTWKAPQIIGKGVLIKEYKVCFKGEASGGSKAGEGEWSGVIAGKGSERCKVSGLRPGTPYRFQVLAVSSDGMESIPSEETIITTLGLNEAAKHQLERLRWKDKFMHAQSRDELRILLVGKTGTGKSATGNLILGENVFPSRPSLTPVTEQCTIKKSTQEGREITVLDTPGFLGFKNKAFTESEVQAWIQELHPGPHAVLLLIKLCVINKEDQECIRLARKLFSGAERFLIVLFTHKDNIDYDDMTLTTFIETQGEELKQLMAAVDNRCFAINNYAHGEEKAQQVAELMDMIDSLARNNGKNSSFFSKEMFENIRKMEKLEKVGYKSWWATS